MRSVLCRLPTWFLADHGPGPIRSAGYADTPRFPAHPVLTNSDDGLRSRRFLPRRRFGRCNSRYGTLGALFGECSKSLKNLGRRGLGSNRRIKVLQTSPLPLGYRALAGLPSAGLASNHPSQPGWRRRASWSGETRFELATLALARRCSTTELLPLIVANLSIPGSLYWVKPLAWVVSSLEYAMLPGRSQSG